MTLWSSLNPNVASNENVFTQSVNHTKLLTVHFKDKGQFNSTDGENKSILQPQKQKIKH